MDNLLFCFKHLPWKKNMTQHFFQNITSLRLYTALSVTKVPEEQTKYLEKKIGTLRSMQNCLLNQAFSQMTFIMDLNMQRFFQKILIQNIVSLVDCM